MYRYFDNSATTRPSESVVKIMNDTCGSLYANAASLHSFGTDSFNLIEEARVTVARSIFADESEIVFTSGGTESNNIAILGTAQNSVRFKNRIITTKIEHPSVANTVNSLVKSGFEVMFIDVSQDGKIDEGQLMSFLNDKTLLVSAMLVNNETGLIVDVSAIKRCITKSKCGALFHVDAVQAYGKIPVDVRKIGCDLLSISAHKIHGIKGTGALYVKRGTKIKPINYGGNQERLRSGTQCTELIAAFSQAVKEIDTVKAQEHFKLLREILLENLCGTDYVLNSPINGQKGIVNISFDGIKSEVMLHFLSKKGFYVSSGSACSKGKKSETLKNLGIKENYIDSALRISFSKYNEVQDVTDLAECIKEGLNSLARKR